MPHNMLHRQIYAGLMEILKDSNYYYHSKYSTLKDPGKEVQTMAAPAAMAPAGMPPGGMPPGM